MEFDPVCEDIPDIDPEFPPSLEHLIMESGGSDLYGTLYRAQGPQPHPTILILHGFPGHEKHADIAQCLRRAGYNVVLFHYRGAWGSEGEFSFGNMMEDIKNVLAYLRSDEISAAWRSDPRRISIVGHSMGAWGAVSAVSGIPEIRNIILISPFNLGWVAEFIREDSANRHRVREAFKRFSTPLRSKDPDKLIEEVEEGGADWDLRNITGKIADRSLLLVSASGDEVAPPAIHFDPLLASLRDNGAEDITEIRFQDDHSLSRRRISLARVMIDWISVRG